MESLAKKSYPKAMYIIGKRYLSRKLEEEGLALIKKAADQGDADACLQVGLIYREKRDFSMAFEWILKAHNLKKAEATFFLGSLYHQGNHHDGGVPDLEKAAKYYDQAARQGLAIAQYNLGVLHMAGVPSNGRVVKNESMAIEYWKLAAENGVDLACVNLASLYTSGTADENGSRFIDKEKAMNYILKVKDKVRFEKDLAMLKEKLSTI
jgi:TPR repeat protein